MKKITYIIVVFLLIGIFFILNKNNEITLDEVKISDNIFNLSMYIKNGDSYEEIYDFPDLPYILDSEETKCIDEDGNSINNSIMYDLNNKIILLEANNTSYCYLYFKEGTFVYDYDFTGDIQTFDVKFDGNYLLETWGAQGSGYGGYSRGEIYLTKDTTLYVVVGGKSGPSRGYIYYVNTTSYGGAGGYNGGGTGGSGGYYASGNYTCTGGQGGGGATHIATKSGLLSSLSTSREDIIIVSGGGGGSGGAGYCGGGHGGGFQGNKAGSNGNAIATQVSGYAFGQAGNGTNNGVEGAGAGGGGYFGGSGGYSARETACGHGGSGYIAHPNLLNKYMTCYSCATSNDVSTKTLSNTCFSEEPQKDCSKSGNGYARISLLF